MEIEDIERLKQLGLKIPDESEYIPVEELTIDKWDLYEYQRNYKQALLVIQNQYEHIEDLTKTIERLDHEHYRSY